MMVGWILCGNEQVGSSRIHGINLHKGLLKAGIQSCLLQTPNGYVEKLELNKLERFFVTSAKFDIVIFQRVYDEKAIRLCRKLKKNGTLCGFFMADLFHADILEEVDFILTPSKYLKEYINKAGFQADKIFVLKDAVETPPSLVKNYESYDKKETIKLVWVGAQGHWETLSSIRRLLKEHDQLSCYELITISNHPEASINWQLETVWDNILACDVGIVPVNLLQPEFLVKSNNRITMFMALGIPVICSPLPSYCDVIEHGENGYIASRDDEWLKYLLELSDSQIRRRIGLNAHSFAHKHYNIRNTVSNLLSIFNTLKE